MNDKIEFSETQRFRQIWIWVIIMGMNTIFIYGFISQVIFGIPFGDNPAPDIWFIPIFIFMFAINYLIYMLRLETRIDENAVTVRMFPFQLKSRVYEWEMIKSSEVRKYSPILEYGGWGLRGFIKNRALNVSGNMGLQLVFTNGRKLLIGTQKPDKIGELLYKLRKRKLK
jgi:hypothetical protein